MASIVSTFLHHSANKIEDFSRSKKKNNGKSVNNQGIGMMPQAALSTPTMQQPYRHPQASYSAEYVTAFNDPMVMNYSSAMASPIMSPSTSWTTDMSSNMDKGEILLDRRSISQGMKLVSIAADEYDVGNETVALDIYLTGIDKILMALPSILIYKTVRS